MEDSEWKEDDSGRFSSRVTFLKDDDKDQLHTPGRFHSKEQVDRFRNLNEDKKFYGEFSLNLSPTIDHGIITLPIRFPNFISPDWDAACNGDIYRPAIHSIACVGNAMRSKFSHEGAKWFFF